MTQSGGQKHPALELPDDEVDRLEGKLKYERNLKGHIDGMQKPPFGPWWRAFVTSTDSGDELRGQMMLYIREDDGTRINAAWESGLDRDVDFFFLCNKKDQVLWVGTEDEYRRDALSGVIYPSLLFGGRFTLRADGPASGGGGGCLGSAVATLAVVSVLLWADFGALQP